MESNKAFCYRCSLVIVIIDSWAVRSVHEHSFEQRSGWPFSLLNDDSYICLKKSVYFPHLQPIWNDSIETATFTHPNRFGVEKIHIHHGGKWVLFLQLGINIMATEPEPRITQSLNVLRSMRVESSGWCQLTWIFPVGSEIWAPSKTPTKNRPFLQVAEIWHPNGGSRDAFCWFIPFCHGWSMICKTCTFWPSVSNVLFLAPGTFRIPKTLRFFAFLKNFETFKVSRTFDVFVALKKKWFSFNLGGCFIQMSLLLSRSLDSIWRAMSGDKEKNQQLAFFVGRISCASGSSPSSASSFAPTISP